MWTPSGVFAYRVSQGGPRGYGAHADRASANDRDWGFSKPPGRSCDVASLPVIDGTDSA
jgi:hypothetical protein